MAKHRFDPDDYGDCAHCPLPERHPDHEDPALPLTPYAGTSGWSGSDTSRERAEDADADGTTSERQAKVIASLYFHETAGVTWRELAEEQGWHHGQASGVLSVLHKEGRIARLTARRNRCLVYVMPEYVNGRDLSPYTPKRDLAGEIAALCDAAEEDMDHGSDYYDEPVIPVGVLRRLLAK